jgi:hypothetical protein
LDSYKRSCGHALTDGAERQGGGDGLAGGGGDCDADHGLRGGPIPRLCHCGARLGTDRSSVLLLLAKELLAQARPRLAALPPLEPHNDRAVALPCPRTAARLFTACSGSHTNTPLDAVRCGSYIMIPSWGVAAMAPRAAWLMVKDHRFSLARCPAPLFGPSGPPLPGRVTPICAEQGASGPGQFHGRSALTSVLDGAHGTLVR